MSKPILSELEYNASDVASAILSTADLTITNEELGVTARDSIFVKQSAIDNFTRCVAYSFNGFMFFSGYFENDDEAPASDTTLVQISDSDFYPSTEVVFPVSSYQGDTATFGKITTSGGIAFIDPTSAGDDHWRATANFWYRFA